jgi:hypothetical protein
MIHLHDLYALDGMRRGTDTASYINEIAEFGRTGKDPWRI